MAVSISDDLKRFLGFANQSDQETERWCKERLQLYCKPCWELKYCPYGPLVERYPLPPQSLKGYMASIESLQVFLDQGIQNDKFGKKVPLTDDDRRNIQESIDKPVPEYVVAELSLFETEASCKEFGHLCPVFFVGEPFTETKDSRRQSRTIPRATMIRVVRRDNSMCQICGKTLFDRDIELDHIIPFSKGGATEESNLRVTCFECNRSKGARLDFLQDKLPR